jgi:hypothetical protein
MPPPKFESADVKRIFRATVASMPIFTRRTPRYLEPKG